VADGVPWHPESEVVVSEIIVAGVEATEDEGRRERGGEAGANTDGKVEGAGAAVTAFAFAVLFGPDAEGGGEGDLEGDLEGEILVEDMDIVLRP